MIGGSFFICETQLKNESQIRRNEGKCFETSKIFQVSNKICKGVEDMLERGSVEHNSQNIYYRSTVGAARKLNLKSCSEFEFALTRRSNKFSSAHGKMALARN